jgi:putative ABC transport system ATP-binding protein
METNLFKYIWRHSRKEQVWTLIVVLVSMPFVFLSYELPKMIINGPISGDDFRTATSEVPFFSFDVKLPDFIYDQVLYTFPGLSLTKLPSLYFLCGVFLALVCVNGLFKYYINTYKGRVGERMLRRLRYELLDRMLRFPLAHFRRVKAPEMATMIKDEVEPLGGFIGDAYVAVVFQGGLGLMALVFILKENWWLGGIALAVVLLQAGLIPRLRRRLLELMKQRQLAARALSGRVGEIVDGVKEMHVNDTSNYERADLVSRLGTIFFIRFELFQRLYFIKFLNNFLSQVTPFLFYLIGGVVVISGNMDIGALVAVITAYKDLPSPIRELINWDQQRLDVQIKYTQVIEQFDPDNLMEPEHQAVAETTVDPITGDISVSNLSVTDDTGARLIESVSFQGPIERHVAAVGYLNSGAESTSDVLAKLLVPTGGRVAAGSHDLEESVESVTGRRFGYVGMDTYLAQGSVMDSLLYGLKHAPLRAPVADSDAIPRTREVLEAQRAGNPLLDIDAGWIDFAAAGVTDEDELKERVVHLLGVVDLAEDVFELGLRGTVDPHEDPELSEAVLTARRELRERLESPALKNLVEPFDPEKYNHQATLVENLMFGTAVDEAYTDANLSTNAHTLEVLAQTGLDVKLFAMGREIAQTVTELFAGLADDHPFFEQLSFMSAEEIPEYEKVMHRTTGLTFDQVKAEDKSMILKLPFAYIEPRHRLGLLTDELRANILEARKLFAERLPEDMQEAIEFYDPENYNRASSLQDNILFGRIAYGLAEAPKRVREEIRTMLRELDLGDAVFEVGLHFNVGTGGKSLSAVQRQKIGLARALLKRPDLLIVNRALASLDARGQEDLIKRVLSEADGTQGQQRFGVFWVLQNPSFADKFDHVLVFEDGKMVEEGDPSTLNGDGSKFATLTA